MSEESGLLSSEQSAQLAGVSLDTIEKYCQIGLLTPEVKDNQRYFKESDIKSLFYTKSNYLGLSGMRDPVQAAMPDSLQSAAGEESEETEQLSAPETEVQTVEEDRPAEEEQDTAEQDLFEHWAGVEQSPSNEKPINVSVESEASLRSLSEREEQLVEMNQTLREQIELLREERDWLRQRIEHLETRSEREQMLLLAESETVRRLIKTETLTDKLLNFRLPWFTNPNSGK